MARNKLSNMAPGQNAAKERFEKAAAGVTARQLAGPFAAMMGLSETEWLGRPKSLMTTYYGSQEVAKPGQFDLDLLQRRCQCIQMGGDWKGVA